MKINSKKLTELHRYFVNDGSTEPDEIAKFLGTEDESVVESYVSALRQKYPEVYGEDEEDAQEATTTQKSPTFYVLVDSDTGTAKELELLKVKGNKAFLGIVEPKDLVTVRIGGEDVEVDIIKLRKKDPSERIGGHLVSVLLTAAELAKG